MLRRLLPLARVGLDAWGVESGVRDRLLGVIEGRCVTATNGAAGQVATVHALQGRGMSRMAALHEMLRRYVENMHTNEPVHTWVAAPGRCGDQAAMGGGRRRGRRSGSTHGGG